MLFNALPIGIIIIDRNTRKIIDLNPQALVYFDMPLDSLVGKKCTSFICPALDGQCPILDHGLDLDRSEREIITGDGTILPVLKTVLETQLDGKPILIECIIDIRAQKRAEVEHLEREKLQVVLEMAGAICHEFNQPLQVISGYCELLKENQAFDLETQKAVNIISKEIEKMGTLTHSLSNITRYETKPYLKSKILDLKNCTEPF